MSTDRSWRDIIAVTRHPADFDGGIISIHSEGTWKEFQELVQRGTNLWPDAPAAIKEFADRITQPDGRVLQDYKSQDTKKSCHQSMEKEMKLAADPAPERQEPTAPSYQYTPSEFEIQIRDFNNLYGLKPFDGITKEGLVIRLQQLKTMLQKELDEIFAIQQLADSIKTHQDFFAFRVELADLMGDLQVYCASEMVRWHIPVQQTLDIIMDSNGSKRQADGTALIIDGKLQKGPNYWKPEPKIAEMLEKHADWEAATGGLDPN